MKLEKRLIGKGTLPHTHPTTFCVRPQEVAGFEVTLLSERSAETLV